MRLVDVGVVYQKIKEMSQAGAGTGKTISVDTVTEELNVNRDIIQQYVTALTLLELVEYSDENGVIAMK